MWLGRTKAAQRAAAGPTYSELLSQIGSASVPEILYFTGAGAPERQQAQELGTIEYEEREVFRRPEVSAAPAAGTPLF